MREIVKPDAADDATSASREYRPKVELGSSDRVAAIADNAENTKIEIRDISNPIARVFAPLILLFVDIILFVFVMTVSREGQKAPECF